MIIQKSNNANKAGEWGCENKTIIMSNITDGMYNECGKLCVNERLGSVPAGCGES